MATGPAVANTSSDPGRSHGPMPGRSNGGATRQNTRQGWSSTWSAAETSQIKREPNSMLLAPKLVREVWAVARQVDARSFHDAAGREVLDDHLPLNDAGIPTIDIIDFDYPFWHKADDLPENCSAESLAEVGRVVTAWLAQPRRARR